MPPADASRGATRGFPNILIAIAVVLLIARIAVTFMEGGKPEPVAKGLVQWQSIAAGQTAAGTAHKPILYDFTAEWSGPCKVLEREVFAEKGVAGMIESNFVPIRVTDRQREDGRNPPDIAALRARYNVNVFPTLVVVRPDSSIAVRIEGYTGKADVITRLMQASIPMR